MIPTHPTRLLFVYGTLMRGHFRGGILAPRGMRYLGPATITGDLYSVGGSFPAYVTGDGTITGEVWAAPDDETLERTLETTDAIEGYRAHAPETSMYVRELVELHGQHSLQAYSYRWNQDLDRWMTPIPSGSWREHERDAA